MSAGKSFQHKDASSPLSAHTSADKAFSLQVTHSGYMSSMVFENNQSSCQGEDKSHLFRIICKCYFHAVLFHSSVRKHFCISQFCQKTPLYASLYIIYWSLLYSAILHSWADSLRSHVILHEWIAFCSAFLNIHQSGILTALAWLVPQESAARESQSRCVLCTPYNHAPCHFMQSHIRKVYPCLAVTCHLHFWQNDRGLLCATVVTRGWNGYRNKSQHRKLIPKKKILPPLQQGFEPMTFRSWVWHSNHWAIFAPRAASRLLNTWSYRRITIMWKLIDLVLCAKNHTDCCKRKRETFQSETPTHWHFPQISLFINDNSECTTVLDEKDFTDGLSSILFITQQAHIANKN